MEQYLRQGLVSDSKVLDIRQVEVRHSLFQNFEYNNKQMITQISAGKILDNNLPVWVITFQSQEILLFRNAKTRDIVVGAEDKVEQCAYAAVITRVEEELDDELTGGWKVIEVRPSYSYSIT